ncbi:hypothetical protein OV207_33355 [Corallococcus sp. BB11-1]|uniref:hypothetical protein n=1 Tax=Corallococcus sp. BB11-1 TaxID=2996783 RepID=UPI00226FD297|nr:hypothetical protein [Corallococcus sp. BB11-1]MCY1036372.1 hypothetical protein [Corallococcus sp. BB11-1]
MARFIPSSLLLCAALLVAACGEDAPPGSNPAKPAPFTATQVASSQGLAPAQGFAHQAGGGIFATSSGGVVRLRLDGSKAALAPHPKNVATPGNVRATFRLGPHSALVETDTGLFLANQGWLIEPLWQEVLGTGIVATAQTADGAAWLAHPTGLFQMQGGTLASLKLSGQPLSGITAMTAAPAEDGLPGLWFARQGKLNVVVASAPGVYQVRGTDAPLTAGETVVALAGLERGTGTAGEVWVLTSTRVLRRNTEGWKTVELPSLPQQLMGAGRFLWARADAKLFVFDADAGTWGVAEGLPPGTPTLLAVDESGCAWVELGGQALSVSKAPAPRLTGLHQGMLVVEDGLVLRAALPPGPAPKSVAFQLDQAEEVSSAGPDYSMGGLEADGSTLKPFSFVNVTPGGHTLSVVARFEDGTEARRAVPFTYQPLTSTPGYARDIRPVHEARCAKCHTTGPGNPLNTYELWKSNAQLINAAVRDLRMPADGPLDPQGIALINRWVASGMRP